MAPLASEPWTSRISSPWRRPTFADPGSGHLQPPPAGAHRLPRHRGQRHDRQPDHRPAALPRGQDAEQDIWLYINSPGRLDHGRHGDLRHDAVHRPRRRHHLHGPRRVDGPVPALRRRRRASATPCPTPDHDAPALRWHPGPGVRHRHPGRADDLHQAAHGRAHRRSTPARPSSRSRPTPSATGGSPPSRPRTTASSTT